MIVIPATKRYILPFATLSEKRREPFDAQVEGAAIYVLAEFELEKGASEELLFIAKFGYPLWLVPKNEVALIFDGLNNSSYNLPYNEIPNVKAFMENLEQNSKTREGYMAFLSDQSSYFQQPVVKSGLTLQGLIAGYDFRNEFDAYRKEATEVTGQVENAALLLPLMDESTISSVISQVDNLQAHLSQEVERLSECLKLVKKFTSQYVTELNFQAEAFRDEADAKIRALQELVNPQISQIRKDFSNQIADLTESFDDEISAAKKQKAKIKAQIEGTEAKIRQYKANARAQAAKKHSYYAKIWQDKTAKTEKELSGLKKQLKSTDKNLKDLSIKKSASIGRLQSEREAKIDQARQPLRDLEASRDAKFLAYKKEVQVLEGRAKPVVDGLLEKAKLREAFAVQFETLGVKRSQQLKNPALMYIPFYLACIQRGFSKRYFALPPSTVGTMGFSAKLKSALGMPKIKDLFAPRFQAITSLVSSIQGLAKQSTILEGQIDELGKRNDLLSMRSSRENIKKGLVFLRYEGWISEKEQQSLSRKLR